MPVRDATGGYRVYRAPVLDKVDLGTVASLGYCFQVDLVWRAYRDGFRVVEVPITFAERERGTSKMSGSVIGGPPQGKLRIVYYVVDQSARRSPRGRVVPHREPAGPGVDEPTDRSRLNAWLRSRCPGREHHEH